MDRGKPIKAAQCQKGERMSITFKHIEIENFCNLNQLSADFSNRTLIKGKNREGKSTIRNAILWVLTDKLESNASAGDSIRPHDEAGNRIDNVEIKVSLTVDVDGSEYILTKRQKQKWVKKRGTDDREFQGNENLYEVSGVPKSSKDFSAFVSENICNMDDLPFCINANAFLSLDPKKRRAKVLSLASTVSDAELASSIEKFSPLANDLKVGTVEEIMKRQKQTISALKKEQAELPARIDEVSKQKVDYDFAELELQKNTLVEKLNEIEESIAEKIEKKSLIFKCESELSAIEQKINATANAKRSQIQLDIADLKPNLKIINDDIERFTKQKEELIAVAENNKKALESAEMQLKAVSQKIFDDSDLICPNCKQAYPAEQQGNLRNQFEKNKADEMNRLSDYIDSLKNGIKTVDEKFKATQDRIDESYEAKRSTEFAVSMKESDLERVKDADVYSDAEYRAKLDEIERLKDEIANNKPVTEKAEIEQKIAAVERQLAQAEANNRVDERIAELEEEKKAVGAKMLEAEKLLYLIEEFSREKINRLEESVNKYFEIIRFKFFEVQINMGISEVCKLNVGSADYDGLLNKSDRLLSQFDLCNGFQKAVGMNLPLLMDDCESVDKDRLPDTDRQQIFFRRDDCKLTVEEV